MPDLLLELPDMELLCIPAQQTNIAKCCEHTSVLIHTNLLLSWQTRSLTNERVRRNSSYLPPTLTF